MIQANRKEISQKCGKHGRSQWMSNPCTIQTETGIGGGPAEVLTEEAGCTGMMWKLTAARPPQAPKSTWNHKPPWSSLHQ